METDKSTNCDFREGSFVETFLSFSDAVLVILQLVRLVEIMLAYERKW